MINRDGRSIALPSYPTRLEIGDLDLTGQDSIARFLDRRVIDKFGPIVAVRGAVPPNGNIDAHLLIMSTIIRISLIKKINKQKD